MFTSILDTTKPKIMILLNNNQSEQLIDGRRFAELTDGFSKGVNIFDGKEFLLDKIKIPSKTGLILELR